MKNYIVTVNGVSYEVSVEEVGERVRQQRLQPLQ